MQAVAAQRWLRWRAALRHTGEAELVGQRTRVGDVHRQAHALLLDDFSHAFALNSHRRVVVFIPDPCADAQALEHTAKILQQKLNDFEVKNRKLELQKRKVLDDLLTLEGYWSGAYTECTATVG